MSINSLKIKPINTRKKRVLTPGTWGVDGMGSLPSGLYSWRGSLYSTMVLSPNATLSTQHPRENEPQALGQRWLVEPVRIRLRIVSCHVLLPGIVNIQLIVYSSLENGRPGRRNLSNQRRMEIPPEF